MKFVKKIQEMASLIITLFIVALFAIMMFAVIKGIDNWRDPQVWIETGFYTLLQVIMVFTWLPEGKKRGAQSEQFIENRKCANEKMKSAVKAENFDRLSRFCQYATQQNINAWISKKVTRHGVVYSQWCNESYRAQFDEKVARKVFKAEKSALRKVPAIKPTEITSATEVYLVFDTVDHSKGTERTKIAFKIVTSLVMSTIGAFVAFEGAKFSLESLIEFIYWCFIMLMAIFFSIRTGRRLMTVERNDYFKRIIDFLNRFEAWQDDVTPTTTEP